MQERITVDQVAKQAARLSRALSTLTGQSHPIGIEEGDKPNGVSWKAWGGQEGHPFPTVSGNGFIGWTAAEAFEFLWAQAQALEGAKRALQSLDKCPSIAIK